MKRKKITNPYFIGLKNVINSCFYDSIKEEDIVSDIQTASYDKDGKKYVYKDKPLNLDVIKLDDITEYRNKLLTFSEKDNQFDQTPAVDAICINKHNEWFFIEFKNSNVDNKFSSIKKKMIHSLWYVFFLYSKSGEDMTQLFGGDFSKFARENINYIIVGSYEKNIHHYTNIQAFESSGKHYTPRGYAQFKGYYFKDVYMLTENELCTFIKNFN